MDLVYLKIVDFTLQGDGSLLVSSMISANWGFAQAENNIIPAAIGSDLLAMAKQMVIDWAADPANGGKILTANQVIVVGGIQ